MTVIKPTVGRVVLFYPKGLKPVEQPRPSIIAHVYGDSRINIATWDELGRPVADPPTSVHLVQPGSEIPADGPYCTWMEFQIGQAQRTAMAEGALADLKAAGAA